MRPEVNLKNRDIKQFKLISAEEMDINPFSGIGREWMLVTAGTIDSWNTLTAAWGGFGFLWRKPVVYTFIRYSRHTLEFMEKSAYFTCSFFGREWRNALNFCGTHSGRNTDKAAATGLQPVPLEGLPGMDVNDQAVGFSQAQTVVVAKKLYNGEISPGDFSVPEISDLYPDRDYHRMFVGSIEAVLRRDPGNQ